VAENSRRGLEDFRDDDSGLQGRRERMADGNSEAHVPIRIRGGEVDEGYIDGPDSSPGKDEGSIALAHGNILDGPFFKKMADARRALPGPERKTLLQPFLKKGIFDLQPADDLHPPETVFLPD
jgi:hypothetical protein